MSTNNFGDLKRTDFLSVQLVAGASGADVGGAEPNPVPLLEGYGLVVLVVVVSLAQLGLDDAVSDKVIEVDHLLSMQGSHWCSQKGSVSFRFDGELRVSAVVGEEGGYPSGGVPGVVVRKLRKVQPVVPIVLLIVDIGP